MRLNFVEMEGFRGFRDRTRIDLSSGFVVLSGRNGSGKSSVLDAIEFALTGTITKFQVTSAKGGGLEDHIWWVGPGKPPGHRVAVGFVDDAGKSLEIVRTRTQGASLTAGEILRRLVRGNSSAATTLSTLLETTLIRDEKIAALSLDLPEQARFAAVRAAIGGLVGADHSPRTREIFEAAKAAKARQELRMKDGQAELSRLLGEATEARSQAEKAGDIADALRVVESLVPASTLSGSTPDRLRSLRAYVANRKLALRDVESARKMAESVRSEMAYFAKEATSGERAATQRSEELARTREQATGRLDEARRREEAERSIDLFASHLAGLLEHGRAVGLQHGHCPLCDATRTGEQFERALNALSNRVADRGKALAEARRAMSQAVADVAAIDTDIQRIKTELSNMAARRAHVESVLLHVRETYAKHGFSAEPLDPASAQMELIKEQEALVVAERTLSVLESSGAVERITSLEARISELRIRNEAEASRLSAAERALEIARQIDAASKTVANEILTEQFDTVMPLLKELYRRLRPHANWAEIESDFGGKIRGSLNFVVGNGYNPQFLFSSGQRRAAGLAFLLAVHLSRPWCAWRTLLLDDPVQHIDDYRALNLVEVLAAIRRTRRQVIVAVEDAALADLLCRRLRSSAGDPGRQYELQASNRGSSVVTVERAIYPMPQLVLKRA